MRTFSCFIFIFFSCFLFAQMPNKLSDSEKIYGLSKFWQEVNYNFIYLDKIDREKWEEDYKNLIVEVQGTENDYEYYRLLQKFCATLKDGHTNVYFPKEIQEKILNASFGDTKFMLSNIDGKAIISRINLSKKEELPIGTEVITVNGLPTKDFQEQFVTPYIASSTQHILEDWSVMRMFEAPKGTAFDVEFKLPNRKIKKQKLVVAEVKEEEVFPALEKRELLDFKWIDNKTAYLALNSFADPKIEELFVEKLPELYKAKALVIDLRYNGGGNSDIGKFIFQYLTNDNVVKGSKSRSRLHIPTHKAWGKWVKAEDTINNEFAKKTFLAARDLDYYDFPSSPDTIKLKEKRIVVPTIILTGHNTASAAEDFLIFADNQKHMVRMGEASFGSTGQPLMFQLPGDAPARICTKKDAYLNGKEFVGVGVLPHVEVKRTLEDYLKNNDVVLNEAINYINQSKISSGK